MAMHCGAIKAERTKVRIKAKAIKVQVMALGL